MADRDDNPGIRAGDAEPQAQPDYRFTLANDRHLLAAANSTLWLLVAAIAVEFLLPEPTTIPNVWHVLGIVLAVLGILTATTALLRWIQADRAIRCGRPPPVHTEAVYLGVILFVIAVFTIGFMIAKANTG